jgi:hypothetical protein
MRTNIDGEWALEASLKIISVRKANENERREQDMITRRQFQLNALASGAALATSTTARAQSAPKKRVIVDS